MAWLVIDSVHVDSWLEADLSGLAAGSCNETTLLCLNVQFLSVHINGIQHKIHVSDTDLNEVDDC